MFTSISILIIVPLKKGIHGIQIGFDHKLFPLLPPNRFLYLDKRRVVNVSTIDDARWHYNTYRQLRGWNKKKRKYIEGALYTNIFLDRCRIIDLGRGESLDIDIRTECEIESTVTVIVDPKQSHPHIRACHQLGRTLSRFKPNTYRKNCKDKGKMYVVGTGNLGSSIIGTYAITEYPGVEDALNNFKDVELYYKGLGLGETVESIKRCQKYGRHPAMEKSFVSSITSSLNYINAAHLDVDDCCECIITWTFDEDEGINEFYFILPNVSLDGENVTIIRIHHSMSIKLDARIIMHCSSLAFTNKSINVHVPFFGAMK